jgi:CRP-like cAMP-binding protein
MSPHHPNGLLGSLVAADLELLRPHLRPLELKQEAVLFETGDKIEHVYFPHSGIISLVVELADIGAIEAAMIGRDSMLGATAALDGGTSLNKAIVQLGGVGETLSVVPFRKVAERSASLKILNASVCSRHSERVMRTQRPEILSQRPAGRLSIFGSFP